VIIILVKCKSCGNKIEKDKAYKVTVSGKNSYYCNKQEYETIVKNRELKNNTYEIIYQIFQREVTNTALFKEINSLVEVYGYEKIYLYLIDNKEYLISVLQKSFQNEYSKIRYFSAILRNSLSDYSIPEKKEEKVIEIEFVNMDKQTIRKRRILADMEDDL
jgi:YHS domain-containing protein